MIPHAVLIWMLGQNPTTTAATTSLDQEVIQNLDLLENLEMLEDLELLDDLDVVGEDD